MTWALISPTRMDMASTRSCTCWRRLASSRPAARGYRARCEPSRMPNAKAAASKAETQHASHGQRQRMGQVQVSGLALPAGEKDQVHLGLRCRNVGRLCPRSPPETTQPFRESGAQFSAAATLLQRISQKSGDCPALAAGRSRGAAIRGPAPDRAGSRTCAKSRACGTGVHIVLFTESAAWARAAAAVADGTHGGGRRRLPLPELAPSARVTVRVTAGTAAIGSR